MNQSLRLSVRVSMGLLAATVVPGQAICDEGGVAFWLSGQYASLAAVPANPGWSLTAQGYYYGGNASATETFQRGDSITAGLSSRLPLLFVQPSYAPKQKVLGGQASFGLGFGYGLNWAESDLSISPRGTEFDRSDSVWGFSDLYPVATLAWNRGVHNWMTYLTGDIPIGAYSSTRLSNIGIGHAAIDAGGGYTYLDQTTGLEFSAVVGATYNFENTSTDYKNGIDSHLDWAASQFVSKSWELGIAGYLYYQLTGDSGSGAQLGGFESKVAAIGPEVGHTFELAGKDAYVNVRSYYEFWAENRLQGTAVFATLALPLGS